MPATGVAVTLLLGGQAVAAPEQQAVRLVQPDPLLMFPSDPAKVDRVAVARDREAKAQARATRHQSTAAAAPLPYREKEAVGAGGADGTPATAEHVAGFGTRRGADPKVALTGDLVRDETIPTLPPFAETNDALGLAGDTGVGDTRRAVRTSGTIGDGPHGSAGDGTGDFDSHRLGGGTSGVTFSARTSTPTGDLDTLPVLFDPTATCGS